jgi:hypothetical protein
VSENRKTAARRRERMLCLSSHGPESGDFKRGLCANCSEVPVAVNRRAGGLSKQMLIHLKTCTPHVYSAPPRRLRL